MGTLRKTRTKLRLDRDLRKMLVRGSRDEILLDLDGDKQADIALIDDDRDGDLDTFALDLTGDGQFNLYLVDTDHNHIPDAILFDREGDGDMELLALGEEVEAAILSAAQELYISLLAEEYLAQDLDAALRELEKEAREARKALKKR